MSSQIKNTPDELLYTLGNSWLTLHARNDIPCRVEFDACSMDGKVYLRPSGCRALAAWLNDAADRMEREP